MYNVTLNYEKYIQLILRLNNKLIRHLYDSVEGIAHINKILNIGQILLKERIENIFHNFPFNFPAIISKEKATSNISITKKKIDEFKEYKKPLPVVNHPIKLPRISSKLIKNQEKELNFFERCQLRDNIPKIDNSEEEYHKFFLLPSKNIKQKSSTINLNNYSLNSRRLKNEVKKGYFTNNQIYIESNEENFPIVTNSLDCSNLKKPFKNPSQKNMFKNVILKSNLTSIKEIIENEIDGLNSSRNITDEKNINGIICNLISEDKFINQKVSNLRYIQKKFHNIIGKSEHHLFRNKKQN